MLCVFMLSRESFVNGGMELNFEPSLRSGRIHMPSRSINGFVLLLLRPNRRLPAKVRVSIVFPAMVLKHRLSNSDPFDQTILRTQNLRWIIVAELRWSEIRGPTRGCSRWMMVMML
ncbi:unnamed protein product [Camellia sinensis]